MPESIQVLIKMTGTVILWPKDKRNQLEEALIGQMRRV